MRWFRPATRPSIAELAVFRSAPTSHTQSSIVATSARERCAWLTSCWNWPTPIVRGSIFTSSASGSCRRCATLTDARSGTSRVDSSRAANRDEANAEAPASETISLLNLRSGWRLATSERSLSVSRDPVPLPMPTRSTWWRPISSAIASSDGSHSFLGWCGNSVTVSSTLPPGSTTVALMPVRRPGSMPMTVRRPAGAAISRSRRLRA